MRRKPAMIVAGAALALGCANPFGADVDALVATDRDRYAAGEPIAVTLRNTGDVGLEFYMCGDRIGVVVERREGDAWREHFSRGLFCQAIYLMAPLELAPGDAYDFEVAIDDAGTYRLRVPTVGDQRPGGFASGEFEVITS